jgi:protein-arginine kinase activator protein McsA
MIAPTTATTGDGERDRKLAELRKLHAAALRAHDFEGAAGVRVSIERVEQQR